ncbi:LPS export ABC transporter periplasmic protein LptC, partial [Vibrio sp. PNB22_3_1]
LDEDHVLVLYDKVIAKNLLPTSSFDTMATEKLNIQLDKRDFWADQTVRLNGPQFVTRGHAMKGNFKDNTATLYEHVQGRYEILTP